MKRNPEDLLFYSFLKLDNYYSERCDPHECWYKIPDH